MAFDRPECQFTSRIILFQGRRYHTSVTRFIISVLFIIPLKIISHSFISTVYTETTLKTGMVCLPPGESLDMIFKFIIKNRCIGGNINDASQIRAVLKCKRAFINRHILHIVNIHMRQDRIHSVRTSTFYFCSPVQLHIQLCIFKPAHNRVNSGSTFSHTAYIRLPSKQVTYI